MPGQKYKKIYQNLKQRIEAGEYPPQTALPPEYTLIGMYDCSRNTVRRAIEELAESGYVQSIHGKGVIVIYQPSESAAFDIGQIESLKEAAKRLHMSYRTDVIRFSECIVDDILARRIGFPPGEEVFYLMRVRYFDGQAVILDHNWFLKRLMPELTPEIAAESVYEYLENELGETIVTTKRRLTVEKVTEVDEIYLDIKDYNCLAVVTSDTYNADGVMFEHTQSRHRPDRFTFNTQARRIRD